MSSSGGVVACSQCLKLINVCLWLRIWSASACCTDASHYFVWRRWRMMVKVYSDVLDAYISSSPVLFFSCSLFRRCSVLWRVDARGEEGWTLEFDSNCRMELVIQGVNWNFSFFSCSSSSSLFNVAFNLIFLPSHSQNLTNFQFKSRKHWLASISLLILRPVDIVVQVQNKMSLLSLLFRLEQTIGYFNRKTS